MSEHIANEVPKTKTVYPLPVEANETNRIKYNCQ